MNDRYSHTVNITLSRSAAERVAKLCTDDYIRINDHLGKELVAAAKMALRPGPPDIDNMPGKSGEYKTRCLTGWIEYVLKNGWEI